MSRGVGWQLVTGVSKEQIGPIFKSVLGCLTIEEGTDELYRNVGNQMLTYTVSDSKKSEGLEYTATEA
jgi:ribosomal protein S6